MLLLDSFTVSGLVIQNWEEDRVGRENSAVIAIEYT